MPACRWSRFPSLFYGAECNGTVAVCLVADGSDLALPHWLCFLALLRCGIWLCLTGSLAGAPQPNGCLLLVATGYW